MNISSLVVLAVLVLVVRQIRTGRRIVASDPGLNLPPGRRFRTLLLQVLEPALALVVVGPVLLAHVRPDAAFVLAGVAGAVLGLAFGAYRARSTYVAAVPRHHGVVLRFSVESVVALTLLLVIRLVAEQDLLPRQGIFPVVLVGLLTFLLMESFARAGAVLRRYRHDAAAAVPPTDRRARVSG